MSKFLNEIYLRRLAIRDVLLNEWDPIGIAEFAEAQDEYDGYVAEVDALVFGKASYEEIFSYLWKTETEHMGLRGNRNRTEVIARRLFRMGRNEPSP